MEEDGSFFEKERDRLIGEITVGFEELLPSTNSLNRKMEEVLGMTREYGTIAELWHSFHMLMRRQKEEEGLASSSDAQPQGLPGTGGHVLKQGTAEQ
ncbi:hypothetical protein NM688_g657 [Phlebia brevispora]|uniref:Uncharacterized protein n=1 Tax=Phlebia brevispora TaxID=194682 RepID=A0ACC1TDQ5_9APHY|nr:hypothetical protein NM688_g657 [Phlebia brevispora]